MNRAKLNFICLSAFLTALEWNTEGKKEKEPVCDCSAEVSRVVGVGQYSGATSEAFREEAARSVNRSEAGS